MSNLKDLEKAIEGVVDYAESVQMEFGYVSSDLEEALDKVEALEDKIADLEQELEEANESIYKLEGEFQNA